MKTAELFVECLLTEGVDAVFGNPGTTELPVVEALGARGTPAFHLGLQEIVCMGMADGYAQATGEPAVVNLHASPGLGNAMGNLFNAWRTSTPLVITVGQQDTRFALEAPLLFSDLVRQASQYTKWSWEVRSPQELPTAVRRAFKEATTPPKGPVFLSLPMDVMAKEAEGLPLPSVRLSLGPPPAAEIAAAARLAAGAQRPVIVAGDRLDRPNASEEMIRLAELLGAPIWAEPLAQRLPCPPNHPMFAGFLPPFGPLLRRSLADTDLVLVLGGEAFLLYPPFDPGSPFPTGAKVVHVDDSPSLLARAHALDVGIMADLPSAILALRQSLGANRWTERYERTVSRLSRDRDDQSRRVQVTMSEKPNHPAAVLGALAPVIRDRIVVDEAVSAAGHLFRSFRFGAPGQRFGHRGGGLGWGLPAALGVSLARKGQEVLAVLGDGSAMYAIQGLWTAAHLQLPIAFLILDNGVYEIIRAGLRRQGGPAAKRRVYLGTEIAKPSLDWAALARAMGLRYAEAEDAGDVADAVISIFEEGGPGLIRVPIQEELSLP